MVNYLKISYNTIYNLMNKKNAIMNNHHFLNHDIIIYVIGDIGIRKRYGEHNQDFF